MTTKVNSNRPIASIGRVDVTRLADLDAEVIVSGGGRTKLPDPALEGACAVLYQAIDNRMRKHPEARRYASLANVLCGDAAMVVPTDAVQVHGGYGRVKDYPIEPMMRDGKTTQIWESSNQTQRLLIAKESHASR